MRRIFALKWNRTVLKLLVVTIAAEIVCSYVFGWGLASLVIMAAWVGFSVGQGRGFNAGLNLGYANFLRDKLTAVELMEEHAAEHYAPDSPERQQVAELKRYLNDELRKVA